MLLSLLPLAGWADSYGNWTVTATIDDASSVPYDGTVKAPVVKLYNGTDHAQDVTITNGENGWTISWDKATIKDFGTYTVTVTNSGTHVQPTANTTTFNITKKEVTVGLSNPAAITFGDPIPAYTATFSGFAASDLDEEENPKSGVYSGTVTFTTTKDDVAYEAGHATKGKAQNYIVTPVVSGLTSTNYTFTPQTNTLTVNKKALAASMIADMTAKTFTGAAQAPTVTVTDGSNAIALTTDYTVSYKLGEDAKTAEQIIDAGAYTVTITAAGDNYSGEASKTYTINRKTVQLRTVGDELTYSHQKFYTGVDDYKLSNAAHLQWVDVLESDLEGNMLKGAILNTATITLKLFDGTTASAEEVESSDATILNAGTYQVRAILSAEDQAKIKNYNVKVGNVGKIIVSKKEVSITPKSVDYDFGTNNSKKFQEATDAAEADLWIGTPVKNDEGVITGVSDGTGLATGDDFATIFADGKKVSLTRTGNTNAGTYTLTATLPQGVTYDNYEFTIAEAGTFKINAIGGVEVWANNANSTYKGTQSALTAEIVGVDDAEITDEIRAAVNASLTVQYPESKDATNAPAGDYTITFDKTALIAALSPLTNYDITIDAVDTYDGTYTIKRAALTVKAAPQVHMVGETVTAEAGATTITFEGTAPTGDDLTAIYNALSLAYNVTAGVLVKDESENTDIDASDKLVAHALTHGTVASGDAENGVYYNGIIIVAAGVTAYNAAQNNYTLTAQPGQLTATTSEVIELDAANVQYSAAKTNTVLLTENAGKKLNIKINHKTLNAGQWYSISLPFDITPFEFCNTVNSYAIFDRFQQTGDRLSFKVSLDAIPAYTPFLVKVESKVKLSDVTFNKVSIVAPKTVTEQNDVWVIKNTIDEGDVENLVYWLNTSTDAINLGMNSTKASLRGFDAYLTTVSGEPASEARIYIEEADGSTTAISAITADGELVPAQGWYTLNGVKLQGVPTQKGVYINNGKKIVIK